jgi:hypothetical protein
VAGNYTYPVLTPKRQVFNANGFLQKATNVVPDKWYELKIAVHGNHIEYYLDNQLLVEVDDDVFSSGTVCVWIANSHVHFDDVIISGDGIPNGGRWNASKHGEFVRFLSNITTTWGQLKKHR